MLSLLPPGQCRQVDPELVGQLLLVQSVDPSVFPNPLSNFLGIFLERIVTQKFDNLGNLGEGRPDFIPLPKIYRNVRNIKVEGKLVFGELQIEPSGFDPVAPRSANIRVFLPESRFPCP